MFNDDTFLISGNLNFSTLCNVLLKVYNLNDLRSTTKKKKTSYLNMNKQIAPTVVASCSISTAKTCQRKKKDQFYNLKSKITFKFDLFFFFNPLHPNISMNILHTVFIHFLEC